MPLRIRDTILGCPILDDPTHQRGTLRCETPFGVVYIKPPLGKRRRCWVASWAPKGLLPFCEARENTYAEVVAKMDKILSSLWQIARIATLDEAALVCECGAVRDRGDEQ